MECIEEKLIELVRENPVFYDTSHSQYVKTKLKQEIWVKIAGELKLRNGDEAKSVWTKLRNNHRDALRRQKLMIRSGVAAVEIKPWKFQAQMEFLVRYMVNENRDTNFTTNTEQSEPLLDEQPESSDLNEQDMSDDENIESPGTNTANNEQPVNELNEQPVHSPANNLTMPTPPPAKKTKKNEIDTLMKKVIEQREQRSKERQEERKKLEESIRKDDLYFFFMSMYEQTKKMPPASQHSVKRNVFLSVSEEEARLLNIAEPTGPPSHQLYPRQNFQQTSTNNWSVMSSSASTSSSSSAYPDPIEPNSQPPNLISYINNFTM